jgi:hypothetical protein
MINTGTVVIRGQEWDGLISFRPCLHSNVALQSHMHVTADHDFPVASIGKKMGLFGEVYVSIFWFNLIEIPSGTG